MEYGQTGETIAADELRLPAGSQIKVHGSGGERSLRVKNLRLPEGAVLDVGENGFALLRFVGSLALGSRRVLIDVRGALEGPTETIAASVPKTLIDAVRTRVGKGEFSRFVTHALANEVRRMELNALAEDLQRQHPSSPEDVAREIRAFLE
jgi:hypothetical protein